MNIRIVLLTVAASLAAAAGDPAVAEDSSATPVAAGLARPDSQTLTRPGGFLDGLEPMADPKSVNAIVEVPAGYVDKWEVKSDDGQLHWDLKDGKPRRVAYLGYPCNYGMVPHTVLSKARGGDGDPLDVLVLGESLPRGTVVPARVIGLMTMRDKGERDVKLVAVRAGTAFADVASMAELDARFPGVTSILATWFRHYKGEGTTEVDGFEESAPALAVLRDAIRDYEKPKR